MTKEDQILEILSSHTSMLNECIKTLNEHTKILNEHSKRLDKIEKTLEEHSRILEEHSKRLDKIEDTLDEYTNILLHHNSLFEIANKKIKQLFVSNEHIEQNDKDIETLQKLSKNYSDRLISLEINSRKHTKQLEHLTSTQ